MTRTKNLTVLLSTFAVLGLNLAVNAQILKEILRPVEREVIIQSPSVNAGGRYLYWGSSIVFAKDLDGCYYLAKNAIYGFDNVRVSGSEITGAWGDTYAAITCVETKPKVTAVVVAIGGNNQTTSQVRDTLKRRLNGENSVFLPSATNSSGERSFYWSTTPVKTQSVNTCFSFARDAMSNFQNLRFSGSEVKGSTGDSYASITCFNTKSNVTAVVMVMGANNRQTAEIRDTLRRKIAGMILFDNGTQLNPANND